MSKKLEGVLTDAAKRELVNKFKGAHKLEEGTIVELEKGKAVEAIFNEDEQAAFKEGQRLQHLAEQVASYAMPELAGEAMLANKELNEVSVTSSLGDNKLSGTFSRTTVTKNNFAKEGEPTEITKHLTGAIKVEAPKVRGLKQWRKELSEQFQNQ